MADKKLYMFYNFDENMDIKVYQVAKQESHVRFSKTKMADPIWRTKNCICLLIFMKICV